MQLHDRKFGIFITKPELSARIKALGRAISTDLQGEIPVFVVVLNGAYVFAADLLRTLSIDCEILFVRLSSYQGTQSAGPVRQLMGVSGDLSGRHVVILEDIVETGKTIDFIQTQVAQHHPASVRIASLLVRNDKIRIDYEGFDAGDRFVVGYGMDYDGLGRGLPDIYAEIRE